MNTDSKLKEMKNRLQNLQNKIGIFNKDLHTKLTHNEISSYLINSSKHCKQKIKQYKSKELFGV